HENGHETGRDGYLDGTDAPRPARPGPPAPLLELLAQLGAIRPPVHGGRLRRRASQLGDDVLELFLWLPAHFVSPAPPSPTFRLSAEYARCRCTRTVASDRW